MCLLSNIRQVYLKERALRVEDLVIRQLLAVPCEIELTQRWLGNSVSALLSDLYKSPSIECHELSKATNVESSHAFIVCLYLRNIFAPSLLLQNLWKLLNVHTAQIADIILPAIPTIW